MSIFGIIFVCVLPILAIGAWFEKSQHARDVDKANKRYFKSAGDLTHENERGAMTFNEEDEMNYLRAAKEERDAYDDFIASMDMADD